MTHKYLEVRRELYETNPSSMVKSYRSFSKMVKLFKRPFWIMLVILIIALISLVAVAFITPNSPLVLLQMGVIMMVLLLIQIPREKYLYNKSERENELSQIMQVYSQYVSEVLKILLDHGIDTPDKVLKLKTECETTLKMREDKFIRINSRIVDMLIGVPLGALITSILYTDSNAVPTAIGIVILGGLAILGISKLISIIDYYSEGYFKDKYLLDAINELDYFENA